MPNHADNNELARNLRFLCDHKRSVSEVCRGTGINRQQFNKYLSGLHRPSSSNLQKIARYFGVAPTALDMPHADFVTLLDGRYFTLIDQLARTPKSKLLFEALLDGEAGAADRFVGCYDRYHYSSIYPGRILRSAFCVYRKGPLLLHYCIERFPGHDRPDKAEYIFKYHGATIPLSDRLHALDFESVQRNEITLSILAPQTRSSSKFLFGLMTGIAATMLRQPFATRVALHYRSPGLLRREHLRRATVLPADDPSIPFEALDFLNRKRDMILL